MKYYVFYVRGENAVTETGIKEFNSENGALDFVHNKLDPIDSWFIVHGAIIDQRNIAASPPGEE